MQSDIVQRLQQWPQLEEIQTSEREFCIPETGNCYTSTYAIPISPKVVMQIAAAEITRLTEALRAAEELEKALREEREELLSQISDCRGSHWLGRQDRKGVTPHLDAIWRGLVEIDDARAALKDQPHADA